MSARYLLDYALHGRVCLPVARSAQSNEIGKVVCADVVTKHTERALVVDIRSSRTAGLTGVLVTLLRRALLCAPVRPPIASGSADILRMLCANPGFVPTHSGTEFPMPGRAGGAAGIALELAATPDAIEFKCGFLAAGYGRILACWRAVQSATVTLPRRWNQKFSAAVEAYLSDHCSLAGATLSSFGSLITAGIRAITRGFDAIRLNGESCAADCACHFYHATYMVGHK